MASPTVTPFTNTRDVPSFQEVIQKVLGFLVGVCLGVAITILAVSLAEKPLEENLAQYAGWERFAAVTLGVPIALLTGYVCRNFVKYLIMLLTAVVGAAGLWKCGTSLIDCPQVHSDLGPGLLEKLGVRSARSGSQLLSWLWSFVGVNSE
ncbi:Ankyrin repeat domain-containing protein 50 [Durusdinium trenchii]|uniref:Ankyrin repeat domain-containing protein 50 n=1 Tax=Durusdinium trenchii TaxID=1381693 RepID=A0ABP0HVS4_9DINO